MNRPFPSSLVPVFQSVRTLTRFDTEAQENSEMAYSTRFQYEWLFIRPRFDGEA